MCHRLLILAALVLGLASARPVGSPAADSKSETDRIAQLIKQLGSKQFAEREKAMQALDDLGPAALAALKQAVTSKDLEICRRAQDLVQRIEKRVEAATLLEPKRIRLVYEDKPVAEAVADFSRRTGFTIKVEGDRGKLGDRRITLDTGETTFWDAFDQFCQKAGLTEQGPVPGAISNGTHVYREVRNGRMLVTVLRPDGTNVSLPNGQLLLYDGKSPVLPTHHAGAVRIRAAPLNPDMVNQVWSLKNNGLGQPSGETMIALEVTPEPKLSWQGIIDARIEKAMDDKGRGLTQAGISSGAESFGTGTPEQMQRQMMIMMLEGAANGVDFHNRKVHVRLKLPKDPGKVVKELHGIIVAQLLTPPQPLMTVDNILKAGGQTTKGADGGSIKVLDAARLDNGQVRVKIQMDTPSPAMIWAGGGVRWNRLAARQMAFMERQAGGGSGNLSLQDAKGQSFQLVNMNQSMVANGMGFSQQWELTYHPHQGQGEAAKLVYTGRRCVILDIPFVLKDVPLP